MKFQYSPGLFGYGTKGTDGSAGLAGLALYFTDFNGETNRLQIEYAIANDEVLWSSAVAGTKLPGGRNYQNMDLFIDTRGFVYEIDVTNNTYNDTAGFLNKSQYFVYKTVTANGFQRYSNIYDASITYIIDTYVSTTNNDYTLSPQRIYGIETKNFARIEHNNIIDTSRNAFTNYSSGIAPILDDNNSFSIVRDISDNTFRIGNCASDGRIRNTHFIFDISSFKYNRDNFQNRFNKNTPDGTVLTNYEKNTNTLFQPLFIANPTTFTAISGINSAIISWNLEDFTSDPCIIGTINFWKRQDPSGSYTINASTAIFPISFYNIDTSGTVTIAGCPSGNVYEYQMVIAKDGWERNSDVKSLTINNTIATMTILDPSNKLLTADASGWFTLEPSADKYQYHVDISTDSPTGWSAAANESWVTLTRNSSTHAGNAVFDVSLSYNNAASRTAVITISSEAPNASIGITQTGQTAYTVSFTNDGSIKFNPALTNQTINLGLKVYSWVRVQRDYALGSRTVRATMNIYNTGTIVASAAEDQTARNETIDASTYTSYTATGITSSTQNKWRVDWSQLECEYDNNGDYENSMVWAEITSVTKTAPSIGGGIFSIADASKFWYATKFITGCSIVEDVSSKVPAMRAFV